MTEYCVRDLTPQQIENIKVKLGMVDDDKDRMVLIKAAEILERDGFIYFAKRIRELARRKEND